MQITLPQLGHPICAQETASPWPMGLLPYPLPPRVPTTLLWTVTLLQWHTAVFSQSPFPSPGCTFLPFPGQSRKQEEKGLLGQENPPSGGNTIYQQEEKACSVTKDSKYFSCLSSSFSATCFLLPKGFSLLITHTSSLVRRWERKRQPAPPLHRRGLSTPSRPPQILSSKPNKGLETFFLRFPTSHIGCIFQP